MTTAAPATPQSRRTAASAQPRSAHRAAAGSADFELIIIGAGPAGLAAAELAARLGARVALIERNELGGTSLNTGSIPSKSLIRSARLFAAVRDARRLRTAGHREPPADLKLVMERIGTARARLARQHSVEHLRGLGVQVLFGESRFDGDSSVAIGDATLRFDHALIATGARPAPLATTVAGDGAYLTSETIFALEKLPGRLAVVGGGPLGCELAQAFCRLGSAVTIIQDEAKFLPREERDAAQLLAESLARDGVDVLLNTSVVAIRKDGNSTCLDTLSNEVRGQVVADQVLVSVGRSPNVEALGLDRAGIAVGEDGGIRVDDFLRTTNPRVYAAGDVCMSHKFTHVAEVTARIAIDNVLRDARQRHTDLTIPWCTFCDPEIAHVGLQAWEARAQSIPVKTFTIMMQDVDRAITDGQDHGFVKLHIREGSDTIIGATIVASRASEMINELCVAIGAGVGLCKLASIVHTYPTQTDAIRLAAMAFSSEWADESRRRAPAAVDAASAGRRVW